MTKISRDLVTPLGGASTLHARETLFTAGNLGGVGAEIFIPADGGCSVSLDLRGVFNATIEVAGTIDGVNWVPILMRPLNAASAAYVATITGSATGVWGGTCLTAFRIVRARCTAYTSGLATAYISVSTGTPDTSLSDKITTGAVTSVSAAGASLTLTLPSPGVGLRHYITSFEIERFATAALVASATPVTVATTNIATSLAFTLPSDALAQGAMGPLLRREFDYPLAASAQNTATTFIAPAIPSTLWRLTAYFYVGP